MQNWAWKDLWIVRSESARSAVVGCLVMALLATSGVGRYLDERLHLAPMMRLRARLGAAPRLDPSIRIIVNDDRSMTTLQRMPTFYEWQAIADRLFSLGFEACIMHGFQALPGEIGRANGSESRGRLYSGVVAASEARRSAQSPSELPKELLMKREDYPRARGIPLVSMLGPAPSLYRQLSGIGILNTASDFEYPLFAIDAVSGFLLPHLSLIVSKDRLAELAAAGVPSAFVDSVEPGDVVAAALPVSAFFTADPGIKDVVETLPTNLSARLRGGKIAILSPHSYTGSRSIDSHAFGALPAYFSFASQLSAALKGKIVVRVSWIDLAMPLCLTAIAAAALPRCRRRRHLLLASSLPLVAWGIGGSLFVTKNILAPGASAAVTVAAQWLARFAEVYLHELRARMAFSSELALGAATQKLMMAGRHARDLRLPALELKVHFRPYGPMSGDWFQHHFLGDDRDAVGVVAFGGVVGKGTSAALLSAMISALWHKLTRDRASLDADALIDWSKDLAAMISEMFAGAQNSTLSAAVARHDGLELIAMGAPPWLVFEPGGTIRKLRARPANPLGLGQPSKSVDIVRIKLAREDVLVGHTDGVLERPALERVRETWAGLGDSARRSLTLAQIADLIHSGNGVDVNADDVTIVLIRGIDHGPGGPPGKPMS